MGRYDNLNLNNGVYIPQYAGLPLNQIKDTADTLSNRHYQNLANLNQLGLLAEQYKSKMLPGAAGYVDSHINDISGALEEIAKNGGENSTAKIGAITNKFLGDQGVLKGLQRADEVGKEIELENNLIAQGKQPIRKKGLREALMQASITGEDGKLNSLYNNPYQSTVAPYEDPTPHMKGIWDEIHPDSIEGMLHAADKTTLKDLLGASVAGGTPDIPLFFESLTKAGIGKDKIDTMLGSAWSSYQQTPAFRQAVEYSEDPSAERIRQKQQFYNHGLLNVYNNISRQYMSNNIADDLIRGKGKQDPYALPTQAPAQVVESLFDYNTDGKTKPVARQQHEDIIQYTQRAEMEKGKAEQTFNPQYIKDYKAMQEIAGIPGDIKPDSKEAKALAEQYKKQVETRASNPWVQPLTADQARDKNYELQSQYGLYEYMDLSSGKVFTAFDKDTGKATDEFNDITGGDPTKFKLESVYEPMNHYTMGPASNEKFIRPSAVVSQDKDGNVKRFLVSALPGQTTPQDINTNVIYTHVNMRPGQEVEIHPRVKARELKGKQLDSYNLSPEALSKAVMPIEATIDGQKFLFSSPDKMSEYLISQSIVLPLK